ncbi:MAG: cytochrome c [Beijerinckiaceae bacterium]|nr:cytochrome c [Beijerinckiaceae bacterium]
MSSQRFTRLRAAVAALVLCLGAGGTLIAHAQNAPAPGGVNAGRQAAEERKAVFKLIGSNFRSVGALLKDGAQYDAANATKRIERVNFLAGLLNETFSDASNLGEPDTKAKPDIWTHREDFDKKLKEFQDHLVTLVAVNDKEKGLTEPFKVALSAVAQDCKSCHDSYRVK